MHFHLDVTINFKKQYLQHKLHNLFSNVKPVDRDHSDVAWSPPTPGAPPSAGTASAVGVFRSAAAAARRPPVVAGRCASCTSRWDQPVDCPRALSPYGRPDLLGPAVACLCIQHSITESAPLLRLVLRLRCYFSHDISTSHTFACMFPVVSYSFIYYCW